MQDDHLVFVEADGKLPALFAMEIVRDPSFNEYDSLTVQRSTVPSLSTDVAHGAIWRIFYSVEASSQATKPREPSPSDGGQAWGVHMRHTELQQSQWPLNLTLEAIASYLYLSRHHKEAEEQLKNLDCAIELLAGMHSYHKFYD